MFENKKVMVPYIWEIATCGKLELENSAKTFRELNEDLKEYAQQ